MHSDTENPDEGNDLTECLFDEMVKYIGTTVTIYTAGGGKSGCGFTGILSMITPCFVRLIICAGPAPCCSLGSECSPMRPCQYGGRRGTGGRYGYTGSYRNGLINNVGSVADIPLDKIAAFVHNAV